MRSSVAIVGGGRWARTIAGVLATLCGESRQIILCSPSNPEGWHAWLEARRIADRGMFALVSDLEQVLRNEQVECVCVVRSAHDNAATAIAALLAGKATFVEKPLAISRAEAERVVMAAAGARCMVGHVMLFASNLRAFVAEAAGLGKVEGIAIEWHDAESEVRWGGSKRYDHNINVIQDVFPHIWSLIRMVVADASLQLRRADSFHGGRYALLTLFAGAIEILASIQRGAGSRRRTLRVTTARGIADMDFTTEPGRAYLGDRLIDVATGFASPLMRELSYFLNPFSDPVAARFTGVESALETFVLAEAAGRLIRDQQVSTIRMAIRQGASAEQQDDAVFALREWIGGERRVRTGDRKCCGSDDKATARNALSWLAGDKSKPPPNGLEGAPWIDEIRSG